MLVLVVYSSLRWSNAVASPADHASAAQRGGLASGDTIAFSSGLSSYELLSW